MSIIEYITVREAAQKWNISERMVQKYCAMNKIAGAKKFGNSWGIPMDALKPENSKKPEDQSVLLHEDTWASFFSDLMPLMNTPFHPGSCMEIIDAMEEGTKKEIALAEYFYFCGLPEKAIEKAELFLNHREPSLRLSACLICAFANLSIGQIHRARCSLSAVKNSLNSKAGGNHPKMRAASAFVAGAAAVLLHLPLPEEMPSLHDYLPLLPPGLQIFALYVLAHYTYLQEEYSKSLGIVETALALQKDVYPIPTIYLRLAAVMDYMGLKQPQKAQEQLLAAWALARPDDLIEAFGEHHGLLCGTLEAVIKKDWPEDFRRIIAITYRFSEGWRKVHNPITGHDVSDNLTTTEFAAAMLAARGWTNQEISAHMNISVNTVKHYVSIAMQKLNVKHRQELKKYMLQ